MPMGFCQECGKFLGHRKYGLCGKCRKAEKKRLKKNTPLLEGEKDV
jgi:NMD protein affecting ribosome stability and mRNA decay